VTREAVPILGLEERFVKIRSSMRCGHPALKKRRGGLDKRWHSCSGEKPKTRGRQPCRTHQLKKKKGGAVLRRRLWADKAKEVGGRKTRLRDSAYRGKKKQRSLFGGPSRARSKNKKDKEVAGSRGLFAVYVALGKGGREDLVGPGGGPTAKRGRGKGET